MRSTGQLVSLALLALASLAATAGPAGACRLLAPPDAEGRWVIDDGKRKVGYRLSGRPHPRFELRTETTGSVAAPRIVCRNCPPGSALGLAWQFAGTADTPPWYSTPEVLRQELERAESSKGIRIRRMSDTKEIALDTFKGWVAPFDYSAEKQPGYKWAILHGYLSDGCATVVLIADTNPALHGPALSRLSADELLLQLGEMLQSVTLVKTYP